MRGSKPGREATRYDHRVTADDVLDILREHVDADGVATVSQSAICRALGRETTSRDLVAARLAELVAAGRIERLAMCERRRVVRWQVSP
jgi:hypothetical protein